jgi:GNAT superfamily N-acetyltransferase
MSDPVIATVTDRERLTEIGAQIARSFDHLDADHYLIPDPERRLAAMSEFFAVLTEHAGNGAGRVLETSDRRAVAVWFDRTIEPTEPEDFGLRLEKAAGEYTERFGELDEAFEAVHPGEPHWHLAFLAVDPGYQSHGLGSALMAHTHNWLDQNGLPAYLEASNADSQRVYRRHGYTDMLPSEIVIGEPKNNSEGKVEGATFYRMWRPAQTR